MRISNQKTIEEIELEYEAIIDLPDNVDLVGQETIEDFEEI